MRKVWKRILFGLSLFYNSVTKLFTKKFKIMDRLDSTKKINALKIKAIRNGGYAKFKEKIKAACEEHSAKFGVDLLPKQLKEKN